MTAPSYSLRNRMLLAGASGVLLLSLLASWLLGSMFERAVRGSLDRHLEQDLISLLALVENNQHGQLHMRREPDDLRYQRVFSGAYWQIFDSHGKPLLQSRSLWDQTLTLPAATGVAGQVQALELSGPLQQPLRAHAQRIKLPRIDQPLIFVVAADGSEIAADAAYFRRRAAAALAILAALWVTVLIAQVHFGLRPLTRLGHTAARVRSGEDARFPVAGLPSEVQPLAGHLNELLDHHARMVVRARNCAADLAHALKTPLAVLLAESEGSGHDWRTTLREQTTRMRTSIERHLVTGVAADTRQRTPIHEVATSLAGLLTRVHGERGLQIDTRHCAPEWFAGAREDLEEMLGNLLDNACKWATQHIIVRCQRVDMRLYIEVSDDGPGLPAEQLQYVLARGVRLDQREPGSGLGLAIVEEIAGNYGGSLSLANNASGLRAILELPAAA
jgi:signal transduction histidine kinase